MDFNRGLLSGINNMQQQQMNTQKALGQFGAGLGSAIGAGIQQNQAQQAAQQEELTREEAVYAAQLAKAASPEAAQRVLAEGYSQGKFDDDDVQIFNALLEQDRLPELQSLLTDQITSKGYGKLLAGGGDKGFTLGEGQTRFDAAGNVVAQGAKKESSRKLTQVDKGDSIELVDSSTGELIRSIPKSGDTKADEKSHKRSGALI